MPKQRRARPSSTTSKSTLTDITTTPRTLHRRVHPVRTTSTSTTTTLPASIIGPTALDDISVSSEETKRDIENVITITPSTVGFDEPTVQTRQSYSTSITFELGDRIPHSLANVVVTDTSAPEIPNEIPHPEPVIDTTTQLIEMVRAELQQIPTNVTNIAVFAAEEDAFPSATPTARDEDDTTLAQLARSIVDHAKRITSDNELQTTIASD